MLLGMWTASMTSLHLRLSSTFCCLSNTLEPEHQITSLNVIQSLMGDTRMVKECLNCNGILGLLYLFRCHRDEEVRNMAAEALCKTTTDKLLGPRVRISISKFLPEIFLDAMKNPSETCLRMYESSHENPELIWNDDTRSRLKNYLGNDIFFFSYCIQLEFIRYFVLSFICIFFPFLVSLLLFVVFISNTPFFCFRFFFSYCI